MVRNKANRPTVRPQRMCECVRAVRCVAAVVVAVAAVVVVVIISFAFFVMMAEVVVVGLHRWRWQPWR